MNTIYESIVGIVIQYQKLMILIFPMENVAIVL